MTRTKVLLALGSHDNTIGNARMRADTKFFRKAVQPVLLDTFLRRKKAAIVFEGVFFQDAGNPSTDDLETYRKGELSELEPKLKAAEREMKYSEESVGKIWTERLDNGKPLLYRVCWGFERTMMLINRLRPGTIRSFPEPQVVEAVWEHNLEEMLRGKIKTASQAEAVDIMVEALKAHSRSIILRDTAIYGLAKKLRGEDPSRLIIIPRGSAHRGITALFPESEYELDVVCDNSVIDFNHEATIRLYKEELSEQEWADYAKLQLDCNAYHLVRMGALSHVWLMLAGMKVHEAFWRLSHAILSAESRKFAIEKNPDCADRLGIKECPPLIDACGNLQHPLLRK